MPLRGWRVRDVGLAVCLGCGELEVRGPGASEWQGAPPYPVLHTSTRYLGVNHPTFTLATYHYRC